MQEEEEPRSTERRSSSIVPAEPGCCPAMKRWFLWEKRLFFNLYKLSAVLCKKPNVILFLRMLACAVEAEEIRGRSDNILLLLRASKSSGCLGEPCLWSCKECGPTTGVLCTPGAMFLVPMLPALIQQLLCPLLPHHIQLEAIPRRNLQQSLCAIWGR